MYRSGPNSAEPQEQAGSLKCREMLRDAMPLPRLLCCLAGPHLRAKRLRYNIFMCPSPWLIAFNLRRPMSRLGVERRATPDVKGDMLAAVREGHGGPFMSKAPRPFGEGRARGVAGGCHSTLGRAWRRHFCALRA